MFKLIQISDTHLRAGDTEALLGWNHALEYIHAAQPDVVIHTGDIIYDPHSAEEHAFARAQLARIGQPLLLIPGNHDIGDGPPRQTTVTHSLIQQFESFYGPSHWVRDFGEWRFIGINSLLLGSGLEQEEQEWAFLEESLAADGSKQLALFMHKPPFVLSPAEEPTESATIPMHAAIPSHVKKHFWNLISAKNVRLIVSGHRHEYRVLQRHGTGIVWCPSTAFIPELTPPLSGSPDPGLVEYAFTADAVAHTYVKLRNGSSN